MQAFPPIKKIHRTYQRVTFADLKIRTKDKRLAPFDPNEVQKRYLELLKATYPPFDPSGSEEKDGALRGAREDILKARQQGMSTLWLALFFLDTINTPFTQTIILTDNGERSETLFRIIHRFYEHLPPGKKRTKKYSNKKEIEFSEIDSIIAVGTAGTNAVGRGGTINNMLLSERAFWPDGEEVERGLLEAVPLHGNVVRETTANGLNDYYEERQRQHRGESRFTPRFFGWNLHAEYRIAVPADFVPTPEEDALAQSYGLDDAQLAWRREKRKDLKEQFTVEYPLAEEEAFLATGNPYFDRLRLAEIHTAVQAAPGPLEGLILPADACPRLRNAYAAGALRIYTLPQDNRHYILAADTAEGLDLEKGDYDSAAVFDTRTWEEVATLDGKWDTDHYGRLLVELGWLYNTALLAIERNNHGHAVINAALDESYPPQRGNQGAGLYFHDPDALADKKSRDPQARKAGWPTDARTKSFALDKLASAILSGDLTFRDRDTVKELLTYVHLGGGRSGGEAGAHDDRVTRSAIAAALLHLRFDRTARPLNIQPRDPIRRY